MAGSRLPAALVLGLLGLLASCPPSAAGEALLLPCGAQPLAGGRALGARELRAGCPRDLGDRMRREIWPVVAWFLFNGVVVNLFFHPEPKYRFPTLPVAFVLSGAAVAHFLVGCQSRRTGERAAREESPPPTRTPR